MASKLTKLFAHSAEQLNGGRRKKLLVLNFGGLLYQNARSVIETPKYRVHDFTYAKIKKFVLKRPFYEEFMEFCFERFDVGVWASIKSKNLDIVLHNMMGKSKSKLQFAWHQSNCTNPGFKWKDNERWPIFMKNLHKLRAEPHLASHFSLSNTLLIDNAPFRGLLNPPNTGIFPFPYDVSNDKDDFLGPEGEMRAFLDGLANAEDVPSYVEENRIGQPALTPSHPDWSYYSDMLMSLRMQEGDRRNYNFNMNPSMGFKEPLEL